MRTYKEIVKNYILIYFYIEVNIKLSTQKTRPKDFSFRRASHSRLMFILYKICTFKTAYKKLFNILPIHLCFALKEVRFTKLERTSLSSFEQASY